MPDVAPDERPAKRLVVAMFSWQFNDARRALCRLGWMRQLQARAVDVDAFFVVGTGCASLTPYRVDDVLVLPCPDGYQEQSQKVRAVCRHVLDRYRCDHLFKCDDDTFIHLDRLLRLVETAAAEGWEYVGDNHGKRMREQHANGMHDYAHGGAGYLLGRNAMATLAERLAPDQSGLEDLITGKILGRAGVPLRADGRFQWEFDPARVPSPTNNVITAHYVNTAERLQAVLDRWAIR